MLLVLALGVCAAALLLLLPLLEGQPLLSFTADDAYISFRYSRNLAEGIGPVFNAVGPRVDGYTSPLWMAAMGIADWFGVSPVVASKVVSLIAAGAIFATFALAGGRAAFLVRTLAIAWLALSPAFLAITVQGFETTTAALLAACTVLLLMVAMQRPGGRATLGLAIVGLLATLTRPDLLPFVLCCFAGLGIWVLRQGGARSLGRPALLVVAGFVVPGLVWAVWRWAYYGYPLPNTSYVKRASGLIDRDSVHLIWEFLTRVAGPVVIAIAVLLVRALGRRTGRGDPAVTWAVCSALVGAAAFLAVGLRFQPIQGDLWRFQMPILPTLLLCMVLLASRDGAAASLGLDGGTGTRAAAWIVAAAVLVLPLTTLGETRTELRGRFVYDRKQAGLALEPFSRRGLTMFVSESGVLPFESRWRAYDLIGLNDHDIALHGATLARVEALHPDLLQFVVAVGPNDRFAGAYRPFSDLVRSGRFEFATATVKTNSDLRPGLPPQAHLYFVRRDAPGSNAIVASLRRMRNVKPLAHAIVVRALLGFGYRG